ncbi:MAG: NUMOD3 domain-containing DNA-binding protein [Bacteroidales bacterium]|jgi:hypothetical protein
MSTTFKPYCYLIGWSTLNKFYYGVQYNKKANPDNLWNNYFTSSKYVKEFRELYGEPDIVQIRKTFETKEKAIQWEFKVIQRLNCVRSEQWLNRSLAGKKFYGISGYKHTEETKKKISVANKGKNVGKNVGKNIGENHPLFGKKHSAETKRKMAITKSGENNPMFGKTFENSPFFGRTASNETKNKMSIAKSGENHPLFGKKHSDETKNKMTESAKNKPKFECTHCHKSVTKNILIQWHNEKCKSI